MRIGIGLPNSVPGVDPDLLLEWAREADRAGFATLATTDRLVYDSYESMTLLAAAAAVTERCRLMPAVLVAPLRVNAALFAKQAATLDRLSGGRLTLGLAVGARPDDFQTSEVPTEGRGRRLDRQLDALEEVWSGERRGFAGGIGPAPHDGRPPEIILGGHSPAAVERAARRGSGWIAGGGGPGMFADGARRYQEALSRAGRAGTGRSLALAYVSVGPQAGTDADEYLHAYYGFAPPFAAHVRSSAAVGTTEVAETVRAFADAGCDELLLMPCSARLEQIETLAEVVEPLALSQS